MLQKIPTERSTLKISSEKECFRIKERVKTASKVKLLEFKEKNSGSSEKDELIFSSKSGLKQLQIICEISTIMENGTVVESSSMNFEELYNGILFISRDPSGMEILVKSIENFVESYSFVEFESL